MKSGALFSECRMYRYALWRQWKTIGNYLMFVGLNPSTADETTDDPTVRRCIGFAKRLEYDGIFMLNLFAFRATDPKKMWQAERDGVDIIGPENDRWLRDYHEVAGRTIAAWGALAAKSYRPLSVSRICRTNPDRKTQTLGDDFWCLGTTKAGHPRHPLYLPSNAELVRFKVQEYPK